MRRSSKTRTLPWLLAAALVVVAAGLSLVRGTASAEALTTIDVAALHEAMNDADAPDGVTLVDVREPYEYDGGHVPGALSMPLGQVVSLAADLPKDQPLYVICRSGNRSLQAAEALVEAGFQDVRNVDGGMISWQAAGYPVER
jgi:rhodanese-related sulfurtransferase